MKRAALLAALLVIGLAGQAAGAPYRIFMILYRGETDVEHGFREYFKDRGIDVELIVRNVDRDVGRIPEFVEEAKELEPDLVYTWGTSVTLGVVGAYDEVDPERNITDIPVVFTMVSSPTGASVVPALESSGRNVTGVTHVVPLATQIRAMRAYRPLSRLAIIYNPQEENSVVNVEHLRGLADEMDFELIEKPIPMAEDGEPDPLALPGLIEEAAAREPQFLYIGPDTFIGVYRDVVTTQAMIHRLPSFTATELEIRHSNAMVGLVSRYYNVGRFTAFKAEQILVEGMDPAAIPVETLARFSYLVKMPVVREIGLYPPMSVLDFAEVVE